MNPNIKNKIIQLSKTLRVKILFIMSFIVNEMYPIIKNKTTELFNNPRTRTILIFAIILIIMALAGSSGNDLGG